MSKILLKNALLISSEKEALGELLIEGEKISRIHYYADRQQDSLGANQPIDSSDAEIYDLKGLCLMSACIDAHVHFREPGLCHKATIESESKTALLGGVTSFADMPNTNPPSINIERIREKLEIASRTSYINYAFNIAATNSNVNELEALLQSEAYKDFAAIKVFMGSSTGNMLVDDKSALHHLFKLKGKYIFIHSEDEQTIRDNMAAAVAKYGDNIPFAMHPEIRSRRACVLSTARALESAIKYGTALHILHLSTAEEVDMIRAAKKHNPKISAETSANYLYFNDSDYESMQGFLKCNPAVKTKADALALIEGIKDATIDTIGSDHAPHQLKEKLNPYQSCPSGLPSIGQSLPVMLTIAEEYGIAKSRIAALMSENISRMLSIEGRGFLKEGYYADLVVFDPKESYIVKQENFCQWSPYEGKELKGKIKNVFLNGALAVDEGKICIDKGEKSKQLLFNRI